MPRTLASSLLAAATAVVIVSSTAAAQTFGSNSPDNAIGPFGRDALFPPVVGSVAETFMTPAGSPLLESFSFFLTENFDGADLLVEASVFEFSGDHVVGGPLFTSAAQPGSTNIFGYDAFTFSGVDLLLTPGQTYALLLRPTASSPDGSTNLVGSTSGDTFTLGQLFTSDGTTDAEIGASGAFIASDASTFGDDAALEATFGPGPTGPIGTAPEPGTLALLATGIVGVAGAARRRASRRTA